MKLLVVDNAHIYKTKEGKYYSTSIYDNSFFKRYLNVFDSVRFCAKVKLVDEVDLKKHKPLDIEGLEIWEIPWYKGMKGLLKKFPQVIKSMKKSYESVDVSLYRVIQVESILSYICRNKKIKYAVEVVNDPQTYFKGLYKIISNHYMKKMVYRANGASYITDYVLQKIYPNKSHKEKESTKYFNATYQTLDLKESIMKEPKIYDKNSVSEFRLIHVANNIESDNKGHSTVIKTVKYLNDMGYNVSCNFVGDGSKVEFFKKMARKLKIDDKINFVGRINWKNELIDYMNSHSLFIFPTRFEGLGRVNLEAMAAGLPCLASSVGGVVELFEKKYLFAPKDYRGFGDEIVRLINNFAELSQMSKRNIEFVKKFLNENQEPIRTNFYRKLRKLVKETDQL